MAHRFYSDAPGRFASDTKFDVDYIISVKRSPKVGLTGWLYHVKWKNPAFRPSWEKEASLNGCSKRLAEFWRAIGKDGDDYHDPAFQEGGEVTVPDPVLMKAARSPSPSKDLHTERAYSDSWNIKWLNRNGAPNSEEAKRKREAEMETVMPPKHKRPRVYRTIATAKKEAKDQKQKTKDQENVPEPGLKRKGADQHKNFNAMSFTQAKEGTSNPTKEWLVPKVFALGATAPGGTVDRSRCTAPSKDPVLSGSGTTFFNQTNFKPPVKPAAPLPSPQRPHKIVPPSPSLRHPDRPVPPLPSRRLRKAVRSRQATSSGKRSTSSAAAPAVVSNPVPGPISFSQAAKWILQGTHAPITVIVKPMNSAKYDGISPIDLKLNLGEHNYISVQSLPQLVQRSEEPKGFATMTGVGSEWVKGVARMAKLKKAIVVPFIKKDVPIECLAFAPCDALPAEMKLPTSLEKGESCDKTTELVVFTLRLRTDFGEWVLPDLKKGVNGDVRWQVCSPSRLGRQGGEMDFNLMVNLASEGIHRRAKDLDDATVIFVPHGTFSNPGEPKSDLVKEWMSSTNIQFYSYGFDDHEDKDGGRWVLRKTKPPVGDNSSTPPSSSVDNRPTDKTKKAEKNREEILSGKRTLSNRGDEKENQSPSDDGEQSSLDPRVARQKDLAPKDDSVKGKHGSNGLKPVSTKPAKVQEKREPLLFQPKGAKMNTKSVSRRVD